MKKDPASPAQRELLDAMPPEKWMTLRELADSINRPGLHGIGKTCGSLVDLGLIERSWAHGPRYRKVK